jgi:gliding motility-associated lipoprotein GldH
MTRIAFVFVLSLQLLSGCVSSPYYQKSYAIPANKWAYDFKPAFVLEIVDTGIHYNVFFIIRHTNNYPYANIWMNVLVKTPGDSVFRKTRIEVPLATAQGRWLGAGMGEIYEQRRMIVLDHKAIPVTDDLVSVSESSFDDLFSKPGRYEIKLEQNMREQSLPDVLHTGLRIEKSSERKVAAPPKAVS